MQKQSQIYTPGVFFFHLFLCCITCFFIGFPFVCNRLSIMKILEDRNELDALLLTFQLHPHRYTHIPFLSFLLFTSFSFFLSFFLVSYTFMLEHVRRSSSYPNKTEKESLFLFLLPFSFFFIHMIQPMYSWQKNKKDLVKLNEEIAHIQPQ